MKRILYTLGLLVIFISCRKNKKAETFCLDAVVQWAGDPAADGLGWVIYEDDSVSNRPFIPQNLAEDLKVDHLKVTVCMYETNEKFYCECVRPFSKYHIVSIRRR